ncbi:MAG: hypothetical protein KKD17_04410 [Nanoarchaeota archaeon]|nr:hypothetical protein [Nanoarchaeota archaeon]
MKRSQEKSAEQIIRLIWSKEPLAIATLRAIVANDSALDFKGDAAATIC